LTRRTDLGEDRPTVNELIRRPLLASALAAIAIGLVGAPSAGALDLPQTQLSSFDRIAVAFTQDRKVFSVVRSSGSIGNVVEEITAPPIGNSVPLPKNLAWAPGAGSLAVTEIGFTQGDLLRIIEHPGGAVHNLSPKIEQLRGPQSQGTVLAAPRFGAPVSGGLRIMLGITPLGVVALRPDGSDPRVLTPTTIIAGDRALFDSGLREVATRITHTQNGGAYTDVVVRNLVSGEETAQLTNTPFVSERHVALSPDGSRVAYIEGPFEDSGDGSRLFIVNTNGTGRTAISPDSSLSYSQPAWRPDGLRIAFIGHRRASANNGFLGKPVVYSIKPDGTDLQRHTSLNGAGFPTQTTVNGTPVDDLAWGRTCTVLLSCSAGLTLVEPDTSGLQVVIRPQLSAPASVGILVERYVRRRLVVVGRVPFGTRRRGRSRVHWNGRVNGRRLRPGRYRITLRRLASGIPVEVAQPVDRVVPRNGRARVARPRRL
jgi:hypothetical protein